MPQAPLTNGAGGTAHGWRWGHVAILSITCADAAFTAGGGRAHDKPGAGVTYSTTGGAGGPRDIAGTSWMYSITRVPNVSTMMPGIRRLPRTWVSRSQCERSKPPSTCLAMPPTIFSTARLAALLPKAVRNTCCGTRHCAPIIHRQKT